MQFGTLAAAMLFASGMAIADCPPGQMPGHDRNGNRACISTLTNKVVALEAVQDAHCSPGYDRVLDPQGRFMCIDKKTRVIASPQRANCPPGTWLKEDAFGYERCFPVP
ncbi:hypothetical protein [Propionivibrio sp.]|uniref:hypothetical protein n=1 Tax=Propionivibrio sp. TaxID=2212460 RepID=UPI003BF294EE